MFVGMVAISALIVWATRWGPLSDTRSLRAPRPTLLSYLTGWFMVPWRNRRAERSDDQP